MMPYSLIPSFLTYSIISGITPGPANLCSFSAAMRFGRKRALVQWRGLFIGYAAVAAASAVILYFLGSIFHEYLWIFSLIGFVYILWLAFHMLRTDISSAPEDQECSFRTGFLVQITNVKIILFCVSALGVYALPYTDSFPALLGFAMILPFTGPVMNLVWLFAGSLLERQYSRHPRAWNIAMFISLVLCAFSILFAS